MPSTATPFATLPRMSASCGCFVGKLSRARQHLRRQQQLAARRCPQSAPGREIVAETALIGGLEDADLLDLVAEEFDPQRVIFGRREDVEDAAAHRDLAAPLDQIDPGVAGTDQPRDDVIELGDITDLQRDRLEVAKARDLRLHQRPHRRDNDGELAVVRVSQSTSDGEAAADRVGARRQPLVRERFPRRVLGDRVGVEQRAERGGQIGGFAIGGGHREHRPTRTCGLRRGQRGDDERAQRPRGTEVELSDGLALSGPDGLRERRIFQQH